MSSINFSSFSPAPKSHSSQEEEAIASALKRAEQSNIAPEAMEAWKEAEEVKKETACLKKQAEEALSRAQQIQKATEVLEGAYEALDKASEFALAAIQKEEAAKARLAALRERRRNPVATAPVATAPAPEVEEVETGFVPLWKKLV